LIEAFGLLALPAALLMDAVNIEFALLLLLLAYGYGMLLTACSLVLEEFSALAYSRFRDRLALIPWVFLETFGYRQLTVVWRLKGIWSYLRKRTEWGEIRGRRFLSETAGAEGGTG